MRKKSVVIPILIQTIIVVGFTYLFIILVFTNSSAKSWQKVYQNNSKGEKVFGDKNELIELIRQGAELRVGWEVQTNNEQLNHIEHIADVELITITNSNIVFAQLTSFMAQSPIIDNELKINLKTIKSTWVLSTNGFISSVNNDLSSQKLQNIQSNRTTYPIAWYVKL